MVNRMGLVVFGRRGNILEMEAGVQSSFPGNQENRVAASKHRPVFHSPPPQHNNTTTIRKLNYTTKPKLYWKILKLH